MIVNRETKKKEKNIEKRIRNRNNLLKERTEVRKNTKKKEKKS